jgi:hypothetical protein
MQMPRGEGQRRSSHSIRLALAAQDVHPAREGRLDQRLFLPPKASISALSSASAFA